MLTTSNYGLKKPESTDPVSINDFNDNADTIDTALAKKLESTSKAGDMTTEFSQASNRTNLISGEAIKTSLGKIMKYFTDLKGAAFAAIANNLTTTTAGSVLDATQGKALDGKITDLSGEIDDVNTNLQTKVNGALSSIASLNTDLAAINTAMLKYKDYNVPIAANTKLGTVTPGIDHGKMYGVSVIYNDIAYATLPTAAIVGSSQIAVIITNVQTSAVSVWVRLLYRD